jgi:hypothetical protein
MMNTVFKYESASVALEELASKGYLKDYNAAHDELLRDHNAFTIDYLYRYEGATNPDDESSVYGLRNVNTQEKGVFVAGNLSLIEGEIREIIIQLEIGSKKR